MKIEKASEVLWSQRCLLRNRNTVAFRIPFTRRVRREEEGMGLENKNFEQKKLIAAKEMSIPERETFSLSARERMKDFMELSEGVKGNFLVTQKS
jgi:hypothetical protein